MNNKYLFLETEQYRKEVPRWLEPLKRQENTTVLFAPKNDRLIRLNHLLSDKKLIKSVLGNPDEYIFLRAVFNSEVTETLHDLTSQITDQLNTAKVSSQKSVFKDWIDYFSRQNLKLILIIPEAEIYFNQAQKHILSLISELNELYAPLVLIISLFEANFTHPDYLPFMPASTRLYENILLYPLYDKNDTIIFIEMLEKLWNLVISDRTQEAILTAGGGHFWLIKQAVREVTSFADWKIESAGMMFRLRTIYNFMLPGEKSVIKKLVTGSENFDESERFSLKHLQKMKFIDNHNKCLIGGFSDLLLRPHIHSEEIILRNNQIFINDVPVNKLFSRKELRIFRQFLEHKNQLISREDIARCLWPKDTQDHYSDWAIDQHIARLRKRLQELSLSPKLLEVVRGCGYRFKLPQLE